MFEELNNIIWQNKTIQIERIGTTGYSIKYDPFRKNNLWTALGPYGRMKDVATLELAISIIKKELEN
jgi:hypothetical protein